MALPHASSGAVFDVELQNLDLSQFSAIALAKSAEQEVIRLTLPKGKTMPEHHVPGEVTLLCLRGAITVDAHGAGQVLRAGQMLYLHGGQAHALRADEDSLALLTILLVKPLRA